MSQRRKSRTKALTEDQIDEIVTSQANDESAWEEPVEVHRPRGAALNIPAELAARAAFLAGLHRTPDVQEWVTKVLRERIELEEVAFAAAKREIARGRT